MWAIFGKTGGIWKRIRSPSWDWATMNWSRVGHRLVETCGLGGIWIRTRSPSRDWAIMNWSRVGHRLVETCELDGAWKRIRPPSWDSAIMTWSRVGHRLVETCDLGGIWKRIGRPSWDWARELRVLTRRSSGRFCPINFINFMKIWDFRPKRHFLTHDKCTFFQNMQSIWKIGPKNSGDVQERTYKFRRCPRWFDDPNVFLDHTKCSDFNRDFTILWIPPRPPRIKKNTDTIGNFGF